MLTISSRSLLISPISARRLALVISFTGCLFCSCLTMWIQRIWRLFFVLYYFCFHFFQPEHCLPQVPHPAYTGEHLLIIKVVQETRLRRHDIWFAIMMMAMIMVTIFMIMMTRSDNDVNQDKQKLSAQVSPAAQLHGSARPCILSVLPLFGFLVLSQVDPIW